MTLHFNLTEDDAVALNERYYRDSPLYQKTRARVRWTIPCILAAVAGYYAWSGRLHMLTLVVIMILAFGWWLLYPRRFDTRIRKYIRKQMQETSSAMSFGPNELRLLDEHLHSIWPQGSSTYLWSNVFRVAMDSEYLYIFLPGPSGFAIRITEIGQAAAQRAHDFIAERINETTSPGAEATELINNAP